VLTFVHRAGIRPLCRRLSVVLVFIRCGGVCSLCWCLFVVLASVVLAFVRCAGVHPLCWRLRVGLTSIVLVFEFVVPASVVLASVVLAFDVLGFLRAGVCVSFAVLTSVRLHSVEVMVYQYDKLFGYVVR
jgi:hypothetical protein